MAAFAYGMDSYSDDNYDSTSALPSIVNSLSGIASTAVAASLAPNGNFNLPGSQPYQPVIVQQPSMHWGKWLLLGALALGAFFVAGKL